MLRSRSLSPPPRHALLRGAQQEPADKGHPEPAAEVAQDERLVQPQEDEPVGHQLPDRARGPRRRWKLRVTPQMIERSTRPPSSGKPGIMLNSASRKLMKARYWKTASATAPARLRPAA